MKLLFLGDIVGRAGRDAVLAHLPALKADYAVDFCVVNADNAAGGFGVTPAICAELFQAGADVITGGDHIWDQRDIIPMLSQDQRVLRPHNYPPRTPGSGVALHQLANGKKIAVIHVLGQVFHKEHVSCPFACVEAVLKEYAMGRQVQAILVDFHAEATSEKMAMGHFCDGRASVVVGSHTHVPTADARILAKGTANQTDAGMCGDYHSVIGFDMAAPLERFLSKINKVRLEPASGAGVICGLLVVTDDRTGLALRCVPIQYPVALAMQSH